MKGRMSQKLQQISNKGNYDNNTQTIAAFCEKLRLSYLSH